MTTGTMTREDTGSFAPVRLAAVAQPSHGNPLTGWMPPSSWADEPTPLYDSIYPGQDHRDYTHADSIIRAAAKVEQDQAALLAAWIDEHASWAAAEMRQIVEPLAAEQAAQHAATTYAQLPPNPAGQLAPEALDAEHQQRQAVSPQLTAKWQSADDEPEPVGPPGPSQPPGPPEPPTPPGPVEPRRLLRDEWSAFWADLRRLPSELRAWWPWRKGAK